MAKVIITLLMFFNTNTLAVSNDICTFALWIERNCKPFDKGMLTTLPRFYTCQHNLINVSNMLRFEELPKVNSQRWLSLEDLKDEKWVDIKGYEDKYQISNYGRVKSKARTRFTGRGFTKTKGCILRNTLSNNRGGYYYTSFHNKSNAPSVKFLVHRLVAEAFIPNPLSSPYINHINENGLDNRVCNLEWCNCAYNNAYGTAQIRAQITRLERGISKPVGVYDSNGELLQRYISLGQAAKTIGVHKSTLRDYLYSGKPYKNGLFYKFI